MMEQNNKNLNNLPKIKAPRSKIGGGVISNPTLRFIN